MTRALAARSYCLAGVGGRVQGILAHPRSAAQVLVVDGCEEERARRTMERAGCSGFAHRQPERDFRFEKGATRVTAARIRQVADRGAALPAT